MFIIKNQFPRFAKGFHTHWHNLFLSICFTLFFFIASYSQQSITGAISVCAGSVEWYRVTSPNPFRTYTWSVMGYTGAQLFPVAPRGDSCRLIWGDAGTAVIKVMERQQNVFTDSFFLSVSVSAYPKPAIVNASGVGCTPLIVAGPERPKPLNPDTCFVVCDSSCFSYQTTFQPGTQWRWEAAGALSVDTSGFANMATVCWGVATLAGNTATLRVTETNTAGCATVNEVCVKIIERPTAKFNAFPPPVNDTIRLCKGGELTLTDSSYSNPLSGLEYWGWDLGDGTQQTNKILLQHIYQAAGSYVITLIVRNRCGCTDTFRMPVAVDDLPPVKIYCPSTVCPNSTAIYTTNDTCSPNPLWSVQNGVIASQSSDSLTVNWGSGIDGFGVISYQPDCPGFCPYPLQYVVPILPSIGTISGRRLVCIGETATYSVPKIPGTSYFWRYIPLTPGFMGVFDPAVTANRDNNLTIAWVGVGKVALEVFYINEFLQCQGIARDTITIAPPVQLDMPSKICIGDTLRVTNPQNTPMYWRIFDENNHLLLTIIGGSSLAYVFSAPGIYRIAAADSLGVSCNQPESYVTVLEPLPPLLGIAGENPVCPGATATYSVVGQLPGTLLLWDVQGAIPGDFTATTSTDVSVQWGQGAPYLLTLSQRMTQAPYCTSEPVMFEVEKVQPVIPHLTGPDTVCVNQKNVVFTTVSGAEEYAWEAAGAALESQSSGAASFMFYANPGLATISVFSKTCNFGVLVTKYIHVLPAPAPLIAAQPAPFCTGKAVNFTASGSASDFFWEFGDGSSGSTGSLGVATHTYFIDSSYTVRLTATNPNGCLGTATAFKTIEVLPAPGAKISYMGNRQLCLPDTAFAVNLYVSLEEGLLPSYSIAWFHNGTPVSGANTAQFFAQSTGSYYAVVTDTATGCATQTAFIHLTAATCPPGCDTVVVNSIAVSRQCATAIISPQLCHGCVFTEWEIHTQPGVSSYISTQPVDTIEYEQSGFFKVVLRGYILIGTDTCAFAVDTFIHVPVFPRIGVAMGCDTNGNAFSLRLHDYSNFTAGSGITGNLWLSGGTTLCANSPLCTPALPPGTHTIRLEITNGSETCATERDILIPARPQAGFFHQPDSAVCEGIYVQFIPSGFNPSEVVWYEWWKLGSFQLDESNNDTTYFNFYDTTKNHRVALIITDLNGCKDTAIKSIGVVGNNLNALITDTIFRVCFGEEALLNVAALCGGANRFVWSRNGQFFGEGNPLPTTQSGTYTVALSNSAGCAFSPVKSVHVLAQQPLRPVVHGKLFLCPGENLSLSSVIPPGFAFSWLQQSGSGYNQLLAGMGNGGETMLHMPSWSLTPGTDYHFRLAATDTATGCTDTSLLHTVSIRRYMPYIEILPGYGGYCQSQLPLAFTAQPLGTYPDSLFYLWNNGQPGNSITVFSPGRYTVSVTSSFGCVATQSLYVNASPDFNELIYGCFERCDSVLIPGPKGNYTYQWLLNGQAHANTRDFMVRQSGVLQPCAHRQRHRLFRHLPRHQPYHPRLFAALLRPLEPHNR